MAFKWRKWNKAIHRDFGYLFFGMTIIYALSGIAINHRHDGIQIILLFQKQLMSNLFQGNLIKRKCFNYWKNMTLRTNTENIIILILIILKFF